MPPPIELATATVTHLSTDCAESGLFPKTAQAAALTTTTPTTTTAAISRARRSPCVSGPVGGVLPFVAVGGSFVQSDLHAS